ncbi:hypothetical protein [Natrinema salsiterrestre]|uniref:Uncharacterized protein n=1 Tax=Natrinema salsiterrestre TaxID=2950540 RepID=A0A9Q4Q568_9EURY|nr:hypothetical protein [Natrinema salsiterrestre]MDF9747903.1 hypothetical protein [Natrinema salsiterrestre]
MGDESETRIDNPEQLCDAIVEIVDELEDNEIIGKERASKLRSKIYRSVDISEEEVG